MLESSKPSSMVDLSTRTVTGTTRGFVLNRIREPAYSSKCQYRDHRNDVLLSTCATGSGAVREVPWLRLESGVHAFHLLYESKYRRTRRTVDALKFPASPS